MAGKLSHIHILYLFSSDRLTKMAYYLTCHSSWLCHQPKHKPNYLDFMGWSHTEASFITSQNGGYRDLFSMLTLFYPWLMYVFTQPFHHRQDVTQDQFLSRVQLVWIKIFPSPRLVALPRLMNQVCPTIFP